MFVVILAKTGGSRILAALGMTTRKAKARARAKATTVANYFYTISETASCDAA
jgi:hypothetical protein